MYSELNVLCIVHKGLYLFSQGAIKLRGTLGKQNYIQQCKENSRVVEEG